MDVASPVKDNTLKLEINDDARKKPKKFKHDAIALVLKQDYKKSEAARSLGIKTIESWGAACLLVNSLLHLNLREARQTVVGESLFVYPCNIF